ncbi:MAG: sporulation protein YabP [Eubacteriales bacterium]|nr:sporulation protein YabP [Eubacteriales bacterium]
MYNDEQKEIPAVNKAPHKVVIDSREKIIITGVEDVDSFNENEVILLTNRGFITITGEELHINKLNLDEGQLVVGGSIQSVDYADHEEERSKRGVFGKVFR